MAQSTTSLDNWRFHTQHVQSELDGGEFLNAASTLIAAGPPTIRQAAPNGQSAGQIDFGVVNAVAYPVGVVESIGLAQNRQLQRLFEIGSKRSYFVNGRNTGQLNLARTLFHGPSLMRAMYAYYPRGKFPAGTDAADLLNGLANKHKNTAPDIIARPGYGDFFINLDSDLFDQPFGLLFMFKDAESDMYGAFYVENAYLNGHQFSISASSTLIGEAISVQFDRIVPVNVGAKTRKSSEGGDILSRFGNTVTNLFQDAKDAVSDGVSNLFGG